MTGLALLRPDDVPAQGMSVEMVLPPETAESVGLVALPVCSATLKIRVKNGALHVSGHLTAQAVQPCVVTGALVTQAVDRRFVVRYVPDYQPKRAGDGSLILPIDGDEDVEDLPPEGISLQALVREELILSLEPYPRAADAPDIDLSTQST